MEEIILLFDYKKSFGSKFNSNPPYSGIDIALFSTEMEKLGYKIAPTYFFNMVAQNVEQYKGKKVLYQSSEPNDLYQEYKSYIDDILYFLELCGAQLIPKYKYFKSHSNKVFMEMLRGFINDHNSPQTIAYGSLEDFMLHQIKNEFPLIVKKSHGAQSKGVFKVDNKRELESIVNKITKSTFTIKELLKEKLRSKKYKNYIPFSINRSKFIIQPMIKGLSGDYKVLIFGDIIYLVKRENPPNDFRASGGGYNTFTGEFKVPEGLLEYAYELFRHFDCPYTSLDIGLNSSGFHLIEFQFVNFGSSGHLKSKKYFKKEDNDYILYDNDLSIEYLYAHGLDIYFRERSL
jgi:glutathione synthase/RimK-type ligase-like ATP-grasp enzyme